MAFNIVDQQGNHRGLILGRYSLDKEIVESDSPIMWLAALTSYHIEDFGWDLGRIKSIWAERWKMQLDYGKFDERKFNERIDRMVEVHGITGLNNEEKIRLVHTWHSWESQQKVIEHKIIVDGYILINPFTATYRENKVIIDLPVFEDQIITEDGEHPILMKITKPPRLRLERIFHEGVTIPYYSTYFTAVSGNITFKLDLPFSIYNCKQGDVIQMFFKKADLKMVFINGLGYEIETKSRGFFG